MGNLTSGRRPSTIWPTGPTPWDTHSSTSRSSAATTQLRPKFSPLRNHLGDHDLGLELLKSRDVEAKPEAWARYVSELMRKQRELTRRREAGVRVKLYRDDYKKLLTD